MRLIAGRKVYVMLDSLSVHQGKTVKQWLATRGEQIAVHHLPSYSPDYNSDERLNRSFQSKLSHQPAPCNFEQLHRQTISQLGSCRGQPALIKSHFPVPSNILHPAPVDRRSALPFLRALLPLRGLCGRIEFRRPGRRPGLHEARHCYANATGRRLTLPRRLQKLAPPWSSNALSTAGKPG